MLRLTTAKKLSTSTLTKGSPVNTSLWYRDDPELENKKKQKTNEHFFPVNLPNGTQTTPDEAEFYQKCTTSTVSTGYISLNMQRQIDRIQTYYITKRDYEVDTIKQQVTEYDISIKHLVNSLGLKDREEVEKFLELNSHSEQAERSILDYYLPSPLLEASVPEIKNPKTRLSKFQLEQILLKDEDKNKKLEQSKYNMQEVKKYVDPTMLSSKDFLFEIADKIYELDQKLEKFHQERFENEKIAEDFVKILEDGAKFRETLKSFDWKSIEQFETIAQISNMSQISYKQSLAELDRLVDHPLYYLEVDWIMKFNLGSEDKQEENSQEIIEANKIEWKYKTSTVDRYNLYNGNFVPNAVIHEIQGTRGIDEPTVCDLKLIEVPKDLQFNSSNATVMINGYSFLQYYPNYVDRLEVMAPINLLNKIGKYHIEARIYGGMLNDTNNGRGFWV